MVDVTVSEDPCSSVVITPFSNTMWLVLGKNSNPYTYTLNRDSDNSVLATSGVFSSNPY